MVDLPFAFALVNLSGYFNDLCGCELWSRMGLHAEQWSGADVTIA
jgi:hypothetical protein